MSQTPDHRPSDMPAVDAHAICKTFLQGKNPVQALRQIDLRVLPGQITGLVGPDGAGKTTLLRIMAGLLIPDQGSLQILGIDVVANPVQVQERLGYMPQRFGLYEDLTVQEHLDLYADLQAVPRPLRPQRYQQLLHMTGLAPFTSRLSGKLSGGMKQKLGLACALIKLPQLLLLDEPTVGVDPVSRKELWAIIGDMVRHQGIGVLVSTAYLDEADNCQSIFVLHRGQIIESGAPEHFHQQLAGRVWEIDTGDTPPRSLRLSAETQPQVIDASIVSGRIRLVCASPDISPLRDHFPGRQLAPVAPRFEDAFMSLMHHDRDQAHREISRNAASTTPAPSTGETVVEVKDLTRRFGDFVAVDDISFSVARGEVFGLLGPNGAGKTTTFRMLCGLLAASGGTLCVAGRNLRHSPAQTRQRIGYMAQKFSMYGLLSSRENLSFYGKAYGLRGKHLNQRINQSIEQFDLTDRADQPADTLPGGYKQRLAMAAALIHKPDVLFLDEPTSGVDPLARREFWTRITAAATTGVTIIVTTHFMEEAEYCDRMLILWRGRPLALGTPNDIRAKARDANHPDPTIEDAFIHLAQSASDKEAPHAK